MKKFTSFALIGALVLSLAGAAAFATSGNNPGAACSFAEPAGQQANLTDEQQAQITTWQQERLEHSKQVLQKKVEWGWITQAQADEQISFMEQCQKDGNFGMMGMGRGHGHMGEGRGMGLMNGGCSNNNVPAQ